MIIKKRLTTIMYFNELRKMRWPIENSVPYHSILKRVNGPTLPCPPPLFCLPSATSGDYISTSRGPGPMGCMVAHRSQVVNFFFVTTIFFKSLLSLLASCTVKFFFVHVPRLTFTVARSDMQNSPSCPLFFFMPLFSIHPLFPLPSSLLPLPSSSFFAFIPSHSLSFPNCPPSLFSACPGILLGASKYDRYTCKVATRSTPSCLGLHFLRIPGPVWLTPVLTRLPAPLSHTFFLYQTCFLSLSHQETRSTTWSRNKFISSRPKF